MPLGEVLIAAGVLEREKLAAALKAQTEKGGRLGTNLIELNLCKVDDVAHGLARLHGVPAALTKHLSQVDGEALAKLPANLCERYCAIPLAFAKAPEGRLLVICFRDPWDKVARDAINKVVGMTVVASIAPECQIYKALNRYHRIPMQRRFVEHGDPATAQLPPIEAERPRNPDDPLSSLLLVDLDHQDVVKDFTQSDLLPNRPNRSTFGDLMQPAPAPVPVAPTPAQLATQRAAEAVPQIIAESSGNTNRMPVPEFSPSQTAPARITRPNMQAMQPAAAPQAAAPQAAAPQAAAPQPAAPQREMTTAEQDATVSAVIRRVEAQALPQRIATQPPEEKTGQVVERYRRPSVDPSEQTAERLAKEAKEAKKEAKKAAAEGTSPRQTRPSTQAPDEPALNFKEAAVAIAAASKRSEIGKALTAYMRKRFGGGLITVVKGEIALGHMGCGGLFDTSTVETIMVPLSQPSMFQKAYQTKKVFRGAPPIEGKSLQERFFKNFPLEGPPEEVIVVPVVLGPKVACLIYAHALGGQPLAESVVQELLDAAGVAEKAFVRLLSNK